MKRLALALAVVSLAAIAAAQSDTTALVEASKDAKPKRKTSTTKVITNADVKKSKGKLIEKPAQKLPDVKQEPTLAEKHATDRAARLEHEAKLKEVTERIAALEAELAKIEQAYFEENDLDHRDAAIAKQFEEAKTKLDAAREELRALSSRTELRDLGGWGRDWRPPTAQVPRYARDDMTNQ
ncbi:MAG TPA: hypothetical protein VNA69_22180 [Thermoanaerobaculia bacterium]|nr:hypothetical protein [Thermoanaerobaculia bacterium]